VLGGKIVEGYRIVRCIGRGGMAIVYEAVEQAGGGRVALKMMSHSLVYDEIALRRFGAEAELLASLEHENLCRLLDRFSAYGTSFLALEYCDGPSLRRVTEQRRRLGEPTVRALIGQLARAVEYVHAHGVVHHDIKPSNVLLTRHGTVKLADFGIARSLRPASDTTLTNEPALTGTPLYMAPEQFRDDERADGRVDHYALACLAYELLAGRPLFAGRDLYTIMREKLELALPAASEVGQGISAEMHEFLARNLAAERDSRAPTLEAQLAWAAPVDVASLER
jgi:serine/threonine protein kinase